MEIQIEESAKNVYSQLGPGLSESAYQKAFAAELSDYYNDVQTEYHIPEYFHTNSGRKVQISDLRIDILINNKFVIELKTLPGSFSKKHHLQIERYLKITDIKVGALINFGLKGLDLEIIKYKHNDDSKNDP